MWNYLKFTEDETLLQTNHWNIGDRRDHIIVDRTLYCHPEISGEGIEYSRVFENNYYIRLSLDNNKDKVFLKTVYKRPNKETILPQNGFICFLDMYGII